MKLTQKDFKEGQILTCETIREEKIKEILK